MRRLLIRGGGIGDCIVTFPAMEALAVAYTEVWITPQCATLLPFASHVRSIAATGVHLLRYPGLAPNELNHALRSFDSVITWYGTNRKSTGEALRKIVPEACFMESCPPADGGMHAVDFHNAQLRTRLPRGIAVTSQPRDVPRFSGLEWRGAGAFVAFQPFAGGVAKEWPLERFMEVEKALSARMPVKWLVHPGRLPLPLTPIGQIVDSRNLWDLAHLLSSAAAYVGGDTGLSHLAGAVGVPSVVCFGPMPPEVWSPRSQNRVIVLRHASGRTDGVSTGEVVEAVRSLL
jgi:heptosyltransferase-3